MATGLQEILFMKKVGLDTKIIHGTGQGVWDIKNYCLHISIFFYFTQVLGLGVNAGLFIMLLLFTAAHVMSHYKLTRERHGKIRKELDYRITKVKEAPMTAS